MPLYSSLRAPVIFLTILLFAAGCSKTPIGRTPEMRPALQESKRLKVVIDAGHGGKDQGTTAKMSLGYHEKSFNLNTALMLNTALRRRGYETILTRGGDFFVPLELRSAMANSNHADLFVSVHYNAASNPKAQGIEVYYYASKEDVQRTAQSKQLAQTVLDRILEATQAKSRGIKQGNFAVIRETTMPAILVEGGFLTNEQELAKIRSSAYMKNLAESIARGVDEFLKTDRPRRDSNARPAA